MPRYKDMTNNDMLDIYEISKRTGETVSNIRNMINRGAIQGVKTEHHGQRVYYYWPNMKQQIEQIQANRPVKTTARMVFAVYSELRPDSQATKAPGLFATYNEARRLARQLSKDLGIKYKTYVMSKNIDTRDMTIEAKWTNGDRLYG